MFAKKELRDLFCFATTAKPVTLRNTQFLSEGICNRRAKRVYQRISRLPKPANRTLACVIIEEPLPPAEAMSTLEEEIVLTSTDGYQVGAYFVHPEDVSEVNGRGVILMTDILGFKNEDTRSVARRFAEAGLPTIVPDLFREHPWVQGRSMTEYETWRSQHDPPRVRQDLKSAHTFLSDKGFASRLGIVGFCFGGGRLMEEIAMASEGINPKVAVAFYPTRFDPEVVGRNAKCSLLFITGDQDELVPMTVVEKLQQIVQEDGCELEDCEIQVVEGAGHAFAHHPKTEQNEIDGEIVLSRAVRYLTSNL